MGRMAALFVILVLAAAACTRSDDTQATPVTTTAPSGSGLDVTLTDVSELVKAVESGVVSVRQTQLRIDLMMRTQEVPAGAGTGIVIDRDGHILTNNHVIAGARSVMITGVDGRDRSARVVRTSGPPSNDLALLKVDDTDGLEPIRMGSSAALEVGDPVVAIGNALGLGTSVTVGIVSALERVVDTPGSTLQGVIQTDAAINSGNSGGPLLNDRGELIGINTAIAGGAENIGFAIAVDDARPFVDAALANAGEPFIGAALATNSPQLAAQVGLASENGVIVADVFGGTPAAEAGLLRGDVIEAVNGTEVDDRNDLIEIVLDAGVGAKLELDVVRSLGGAERLAIEVIVGSR